jgi:hypothetical protein
MLKENIDVNDVCNLLNELLNLDRKCIRALFEYHLPCKDEISDHPTVQVRSYDDSLGFLGILNGFFGVREDGRGPICIEEDENKKIKCFKPTPYLDKKNENKF